MRCGHIDRGGRQQVACARAMEAASKMDFATSYAIGGYAACSSLMLIVNKLAVHLLPAPSFVLLAQACPRSKTPSAESAAPSACRPPMRSLEAARELRAALGWAILTS